MIRQLLLACVVFALFSCKTRHLNIDKLDSKRIVFLGDSITNNGLYVSFIEHHLLKQGIHADIISVGLSSETTSGLSEKNHPFPRPCIHNRLDEVLRLTQADVVVACYGMNDGIYHPQSRERLLAYQIGIQQLAVKVKSAGAQIIFMSPPPFDPRPISKKTVAKNSPDFSYKTPYIGYNDVLENYSTWLKTLPYTLVDQNSSLMNYLEFKRQSEPSFSLAKDGIHPDGPGHLLMAYTFLDEMGMSVSTSNLLKDEQRITATELFKKVQLRRKQRSKGWLEYIGYDRGKIVKVDSVVEVEKRARQQKEEIIDLLKNQ